MGSAGVAGVSSGLISIASSRDLIRNSGSTLSVRVAVSTVLLSSKVQV